MAWRHAPADVIQMMPAFDLHVDDGTSNKTAIVRGTLAWPLHGRSRTIRMTKHNGNFGICGSLAESMQAWVMDYHYWNMSCLLCSYPQRWPCLRTCMFGMPNPTKCSAYDSWQQVLGIESVMKVPLHMCHSIFHKTKL